MEAWSLLGVAHVLPKPKTVNQFANDKSWYQNNQIDKSKKNAHCEYILVIFVLTRLQLERTFQDSPSSCFCGGLRQFLSSALSLQRPQPTNFQGWQAFLDVVLVVWTRFLGSISRGLNSLEPLENKSMRQQVWIFLCALLWTFSESSF